MRKRQNTKLPKISACIHFFVKCEFREPSFETHVVSYLTRNNALSDNCSVNTELLYVPSPFICRKTDPNPPYHFYLQTISHFLKTSKSKYVLLSSFPSCDAEYAQQLNKVLLHHNHSNVFLLERDNSFVNANACNLPRSLTSAQHITMPYSTAVLGNLYQAFFIGRLNSVSRKRLYNFYFNERNDCTCLDSKSETCSEDTATICTTCADGEDQNECTQTRENLVRNFPIKYFTLILTSLSQFCICTHGDSPLRHFPYQAFNVGCTVVHFDFEYDTAWPSKQILHTKNSSLIVLKKETNLSLLRRVPKSSPYENGLAIRSVLDYIRSVRP